jgi:hypothetical protein
VYRAFDRLNRQNIALKRVLAPGEPTLAATDGEIPSAMRASTPKQTQSQLRLALAYEFQTLGSLRHPHVIGVLDYGFDAEQSPYFTNFRQNAPQLQLGDEWGLSCFITLTPLRARTSSTVFQHVSRLFRT